MSADMWPSTPIDGITAIGNLRFHGVMVRGKWDVKSGSDLTPNTRSGPSRLV